MYRVGVFMFSILMERASSLIHGDQTSGFEQLVDQIEESYDNDAISGSQYDKLMREIQEYL